MAAPTTTRVMRQRSAERPRYYLLPGQGGSNYRRKQRRFVRYSIAVGLVVSLTFALVTYFVYRLPGNW